MKQSALLAALFLFGSLSLFSQSAPPPAHQQEELPKPTNLKVLPKDISPEQLHAIMHGYSEALGVHCSFCHEVDEKTHKRDFAADTKPDKDIARTMIAMTQEINSKFMTQINDPDAKPEDKTVTCSTCHRGNSMPTQFVPPPGAHQEHHDHGDAH